jgi:hypothetical protein
MDELIGKIVFIDISQRVQAEIDERKRSSLNWHAVQVEPADMPAVGAAIFHPS